MISLLETTLHPQSVRIFINIKKVHVRADFIFSVKYVFIPIYNN